MTLLTNVNPQLDGARTAAEAALSVLPTGSALQVGEPDSNLATATLAGQAVTARFAGAARGQVAIVVAEDLVNALRDSPLGPLDLAKAIKPALEAAASIFGPVIVDPGQALDPAVALAGLAAQGDAVFVPLTDGTEVRAAVALVGTPWPTEPVPVAAEPTPTPTPTPVPGSTPSVERSRAGLDLLRDVAMEVTAELGRTSMTVRELLSLTPGAVVELDRAAGSPADLLVNGRLIARGEVVVIDESFGIRITEIIDHSGDRAQGRT